MPKEALQDPDSPPAAFVVKQNAGCCDRWRSCLKFCFVQAGTRALNVRWTKRSLFSPKTPFMLLLMLLFFWFIKIKKKRSTKLQFKLFRTNRNVITVLPKCYVSTCHLHFPSFSLQSKKTEVIILLRSGATINKTFPFIP